MADDQNVKVKLLANPWDHSIPDAKLYDLLLDVGRSRANHVEKMYSMQQWPRESLGLALMIPAAPPVLLPEEALMATIAIGPEGDKYVVNAIAKAFSHHIYGKPAGYGVYVDLAQSTDGDFAYGFSTVVDDMIAAASGQQEIQDACEAAHAAATILYYIRRERQAWFDAQEERPRWFCNQNLPSDLFTRTAAQPSIYTPN